jgi:hypothetical protein
MTFPALLQTVLCDRRVSVRMTSHGARLEGPGAVVTPELRAAAEEHRPRLNVLAKVMRAAVDERGRTLAPCFDAWPGDLEAGFLTMWFAEFGGELREEEPFDLPPASTITDPAAFCDSLHMRLRKAQRGALPQGGRETLRGQLARLYERFGHRAEALPDPTGTRPPVVYSEDSEEAEAPRRPRRRESAGRGGGARAA